MAKEVFNQETTPQNFSATTIKKWVAATAGVSLVVTSIALSFYNLYLNGRDQHNVAGLERDYGQLTSSLLAIKDQIDQERQSRLRTTQTLDHLSNALTHYQDNLASVQTELVKLRYDMNTLQKMPQFEVERRMEILSLLAADVSIEYARQKLLIGYHFDAAISQLKQARERLALSESDHTIILRALDNGIIQLENLQLRYQDLRIMERLASLNESLKELSFKKLLQPVLKTEMQDQNKSSLREGIAQYFQHALAELKSAFVMRKGQQIDLTTLTPEGESKMIDHLKAFITQAQEAYVLGDAAWYKHQLELAEHLAQQYLDKSNQKVAAWLLEMKALEEAPVGIDEANVSAIFDPLKQALIGEKPGSLEQVIQAPAVSVEK